MLEQHAQIMPITEILRHVVQKFGVSQIFFKYNIVKYYYNLK